MPSSSSRRAWAIALGAMGVAFAALLLTPLRPDTVLAVLARRVPLPGPLASVDRGDLWWGLEDVANALLFVPLGFALTRVLGRAVSAAGAGLLVSAIVELVQLWVPGRDGSLLDVACNTVGGVVGALMATCLGRRASSGTRDEERASPASLPGTDGRGREDEVVESR